MSKKIKILALARKEATDILSNRIYLLLVLVQLFIIFGAYGLAISSSIVTDPDLLDQWGALSTIQVGIPLELKGSNLEQSLKNEKLNLIHYNSVEAGINQVGKEIIAMIYVYNDKGDVILQIDNTNVFYPVMANKINIALKKYQLQEQLSNKGYSSQEIKIIQNPLEVKEKALKKDFISHIALESSYFVEIMYGFIVPFILLLPFFLASNIVTDSVVGERERKTFEVLLMTPLTGTMVITGKILPILIFSLLQSIAWIILLYILNVPIFNPLLVLLLLFFVGLGFIGMGVLISMVVDSTKEANSAITLLLFFATFVLFLPLFADISAFGGFLNVNPTLLMVRISSTPFFSPKWLLEIIPTILISLIIFVLSIRLFREERAIRL